MDEIRDAPTASQASEDRRRGRLDAIKAFLSEYAPSPNDDLLSQILITVCRLSADHVDRGDLKILNTALKELRYAFKVFAPFRAVPKVTIFGSARTSEEHPQYVEARRFADLIQQAGWMVITGAGDGIMRAGHHGATPQRSFGVAISLPFEQFTNNIIANDPKLVNFKYFFTRKLMFIKEANAVVVFPGGFGTQDECFESLTLVQTVKAAPTPIVLCNEPGGQYWQHWRRYVEKELLANGMVDPADMNLFYVADRAEDAVAEVLRYYHVYHSCRFVGDQFVIRLNRALPVETLAEINDTYADILSGGRFEQVDHPLEGEGGAYADKSRLVFSFDRRSAGRLRALINRVNSEP